MFKVSASLEHAACSRLRKFWTGDRAIQVRPKLHLARHVTSRYDTARAFCSCRACRTARLDTLVSTHYLDTSNVSLFAEMWRDKPGGILALRNVQTYSAEQGPHTLGFPAHVCQKFYEVKVAC